MEVSEGSRQAVVVCAAVLCALCAYLDLGADLHGVEDVGALPALGLLQLHLVLLLGRRALQGEGEGEGSGRWMDWGTVGCQSQLAKSAGSARRVDTATQTHTPNTTTHDTHTSPTPTSTGTDLLALGLEAGGGLLLDLLLFLAALLGGLHLHLGVGLQLHLCLGLALGHGCCLGWGLVVAVCVVWVVCGWVVCG